MPKLDQIFNGWRDYLSKETNQTAKARAQICNKCDHKIKKKVVHLMKDFTLNNIEGTVCELCNCPLSAKVRSKESKCDLDKW